MDLVIRTNHLQLLLSVKHCFRQIETGSFDLQKKELDHMKYNKGDPILGKNFFFLETCIP